MSDRLKKIKNKNPSFLTSEHEQDRNWLIEEVGKLRDDTVENLLMISSRDSLIKAFEKKIESLTQQLEEANHILMDIPANSNPDLMIRELIKERDELMEEIKLIAQLSIQNESALIYKLVNEGVVEKFKNLEAENALLKTDLGLTERWNSLQDQLAELTKENAELKGKLATSMDLLKDWDDDCADLQKKLATSEKARLDAENYNAAQWGLKKK